MEGTFAVGQNEIKLSTTHLNSLNGRHSIRYRLLIRDICVLKLQSAVLKLSEPCETSQRIAPQREAA